MTTQEQKEKTITQKKDLNLWAVYGICFLISTIFFFLFGFNSPLYKFNTDVDFNWFMTTGNGLANGKIPYRDLFEHKGPIVYFVFAFACLFPTPRFIILLLEIISMSLFFFFAYKISKKFLNTFYSLVVIPLLAFAVFTSFCNMRNGSTVEEFALPIYTYFLFCWLEFLKEKKNWNSVRCLCIGLCFGVIFWVKYTLVYFIITPMIIWLSICLYHKEWRKTMYRILVMLGGFILISIPILFYYGLNHSLNDLFNVYFYINLTAYGSLDWNIFLKSIKLFFSIGPTILILIFVGVISFIVDNKQNNIGWILLVSFLTTLIFLALSCKQIIYYYGCLFPYAILGLIYILKVLNIKLILCKFNIFIYVIIVGLCTISSFPFIISTTELSYNANKYATLAIAETIINDHSPSIEKTLFCYKIYDYGFYNAANIIPNNYFFGKNFFTEDRLPQLYISHEKSIRNQSSYYVVTKLEIWENEQNFLSQFYQPYTGMTETSIYYHFLNNRFHYDQHKFILLKKQ